MLLIMEYQQHDIEIIMERQDVSTVMQKVLGHLNEVAEHVSPYLSQQRMQTLIFGVASTKGRERSSKRHCKADHQYHQYLYECHCKLGH